ncbi:phage gp36-like protein [Inhella inkyongensis]|uniref:Phage gp36-like protein n=1 Tax=Inhella inkyongensis TaxID=392593 RepID=A0A840S275_9BURK|nr:phage protein Gp36 family protein [Inhella inkyongensis]MBB5204405.1 phage gp36-like protein [Inhella inkyongensis]
MAYATLEHLLHAATGGWDELAQRGSTSALVDGELLRLTVQGGDRSAYGLAAQADADGAVTRMTAALELASRHADTHLFPRYRTAMPLAPALVAGSDLPTVVATIALKRLYGTTVPEEIRKGAQWAEDYLMSLAKGQVSLGEADTEVAQPAGRSVARTPAKAFDWDRY